MLLVLMVMLQVVIARKVPLALLLEFCSYPVVCGAKWFETTPTEAPAQLRVPLLPLPLSPIYCWRSLTLGVTWWLP